MVCSSKSKYVTWDSNSANGNNVQDQVFSVDWKSLSNAPAGLYFLDYTCGLRDYPAVPKLTVTSNVTVKTIPVVNNVTADSCAATKI